MSALYNLVAGATYRMRITVTDGSTVPAIVETTVLYQGESILVIDDGQQIVDITLAPSSLGKGSGVVTWRTTAEFDVRGFNVVTVDKQGRRVQLNPGLGP